MSVKVLKPVNMLQQPPPEQDSPKNILNVLNDDCIREILKKLHISTLIKVVDVCTRFNRIAKEAFLTKYRSKIINIFDLEWNRNPTSVQIENFLSEFGPIISSITTLISRFDSERYESIKNVDSTFKKIVKYCKNLNHLELCILKKK